VLRSLTSWSIQAHATGGRLCNYTLTFFDPDRKEKTETRGHREMRQSRGKFVPPIEKGALRDSGGEHERNRRCAHPRTFIEDIEKNGMWIGKYKDDYIVEQVDRTLTLG
jgi:hypothetical protein